MNRKTYVYDKATGQMVEKGKYQATDPVAPAVIDDTIEQGYCHADQQWHTSKSAMRKSAEARGWVDEREFSDSYLEGRRNAKAREAAETRRQEIRAEILKAYAKSGGH